MYHLPHPAPLTCLPSSTSNSKWNKTMWKMAHHPVSYSSQTPGSHPWPLIHSLILHIEFYSHCLQNRSQIYMLLFAISTATTLIRGSTTFNFWATVIVSACLPFLAPSDPAARGNVLFYCLVMFLLPQTVGQVMMVSFTVLACPISLLTYNTKQHGADS